MENITVNCVIKAPIEIVWQYFTNPEHVMHWNHASEDWHTSKAENNFVVGGAFCYTMAAKDASFQFDFSGKYTLIKEYQQIEYTLDDERTVSIRFSESNEATEIIEIFEAEQVNPIEMQQFGWQAILDNFKKYVESN